MSLFNSRTSLIVIVVLAIALVAVLGVLLTQGQQTYIVHLLKCNSTFVSSQANYTTHNSVDAAKQYADANLGGTYDVAYVIDPSRESSVSIIWSRSTGSCYDGSDWFVPGS